MNDFSGAGFPGSWESGRDRPSGGSFRGKKERSLPDLMLEDRITRPDYRLSESQNWPQGTINSRRWWEENITDVILIDGIAGFIEMTAKNNFFNDYSQFVTLIGASFDAQVTFDGGFKMYRDPCSLTIVQSYFVKGSFIELLRRENLYWNTINWTILKFHSSSTRRYSPASTWYRWYNSLANLTYFAISYI